KHANEYPYFIQVVNDEHLDKNGAIPRLVKFFVRRINDYLAQVDGCIQQKQFNLQHHYYRNGHRLYGRYDCRQRAHTLGQGQQGNNYYDYYAHSPSQQAQQYGYYSNSQFHHVNQHQRNHRLNQQQQNHHFDQYHQADYFNSRQIRY
ncbi:unnamed protein product, partial [Rotaria sp. Silwood2]